MLYSVFTTDLSGGALLPVDGVTALLVDSVALLLGHCKSSDLLMAVFAQDIIVASKLEVFVSFEKGRISVVTK